MIIYGWGHFNRRDHQVIRATCQSCGRHGHMPSYTSSRFFTLYFIPLIPLGTRKVIADCPHCKQARVMSLRTWNKLRRTELPAAVSAYEANPASEEAAKQVLSTIIGLQDVPALRRVGPQIRRAFERDAKLLCFLAGTYDHLCLDKEADEAYLAAMSVSDDAEIAAEANLHMEAQKLPKPAAPNRLWQSLPVLIVPAALLFFATLFVQRAATSRIEHALVLNGLERSYTALINGEPVKLGPHQRLPGSMLVYGENEIAPTPESPFIETVKFSLHAPWYRRPFGGPLVVVNPDRAAVLLWERSGYAVGPVPDSAYQYRLASGRVLHTYEDIDFPFRDFPSTIKMPSSSSLVYRYRVSELGEHDVQRVAQVLLGNKLPEEMQGYLRARLRATENDANVIFLAASLLPAEDFLSIAEPRIAARPVAVEWHRAYQSVLENRPEGRDLVARYRAFAEQEPDNSALLYLYSRLLDDPDECIATLRRAAALPHPIGHASYALAYRQIIDGDFAAALASCDAALQVEPKNEQFQSMRMSALYGLRRYDVLEQVDVLKSPTADLNAFYEHVYRLAKLGRVAAAKAEVPQLVTKLAWSKENEPVAQAYLESAIAIATQDRAAYLAAAARIKDNSWAFEQALVAGKLDEALRLAEAAPENIDALEHLVLYVLLHRKGKAEPAAAHLELAAAALASGRSDQPRWASWLRGDTPPEPRIAAHACDDLDTHGVLLCALAERFPDRAEAYLARAAAMKSKDTFHTLALADVMPR